MHTRLNDAILGCLLLLLWRLLIFSSKIDTTHLLQVTFLYIYNGTAYITMFAVQLLTAYFCVSGSVKVFSEKCKNV